MTRAPATRALGVALLFLIGGLVASGVPTTPTGAAPPQEDTAGGRKDAHGDPLPAGARTRLGTVRFRPPNPPSAVAISPDGGLLATGATGDDAVRLWDVETGREKAILEGHGSGVQLLVFLFGGKQLLTGEVTYRGGTKIRIWDVKEGDLDQEEQPGGGGTVALAVSPDGSAMLGTGMTFGGSGMQFSLGVWDPTSGRKISTLAGNLEKGITAAAFSADGKTVVTGGQDRMIRIWDVEAGSERKSIEAPGEDPEEEPNPFGFSTSGGGLQAIAVSADGKRVASSATVPTKDAGIRIWDADTGSEIRHLVPSGRAEGGAPFHPGQFRFIDGGKKLLAYDPAGELILWEADTAKEVWRRPLASVGALAISEDGKRIAAAGPSIHLIDAATGQSAAATDAHGGAVSRLVFAPDGKTLVSGAATDAVRTWEIASGKPGKRREDLGSGAFGLECAARGGHVLAVSDDGTLRVRDGKGRKTLVELDVDPAGLARLAPGIDRLPAAEEDPGPGRRRTAKVSAFALSPAGDHLVAGKTDGKVDVWKVGRGKRQKEVAGHSGAVLEVAFSSDGHDFATWGADGKAMLWKAATAKSSGEIPTHGGGDGARAVFAPDLGRLAVGDASGQMHVYDIANERELYELKVHDGPFSVLRISPDGRRVVTRSVTGAGAGFQDMMGSGGSKARLPVWDIETGFEVFAVEPREVEGEDDAITIEMGPNGPRIVRGGRREGVASVTAFSPDGRLFVSAGEDPTVRVHEGITGGEVLAFEGHRGEVEALRFSPDGGLLASGGADTTILLWEIRPGADGAERPDDGPIDELWDELAAEDARIAFDAMARLVEKGDGAVGLIGEKLSPVEAATPEGIEKMLADLGSEDYDTREAASDALAKLGPAAEMALRKGLGEAESAEARKKIRFLLVGLGPLARSWPSEPVRRHRAIAVLERIGSGQAKAVLKELAGGAPLARLTQDAAAALERLDSAGR